MKIYKKSKDTKLNNHQNKENNKLKRVPQKMINKQVNWNKWREETVPPSKSSTSAKTAKDSPLFSDRGKSTMTFLNSVILKASLIVSYPWWKGLITSKKYRKLLLDFTYFAHYIRS